MHLFVTHKPRLYATLIHTHLETTLISQAMAHPQHSAVMRSDS